jgi:hypothetical protein
VFRDVILDEAARLALDSATITWGDTERAWQAIEWTLARDPQVGVPLNDTGSVRAFVYQGAKSIGQPDIEVIYEIQAHSVVIRNAVFSNARASHAGRA